jgi:hypothetical protein
VAKTRCRTRTPQQSFVGYVQVQYLPLGVECPLSQVSCDVTLSCWRCCDQEGLNISVIILCEQYSGQRLHHWLCYKPVNTHLHTSVIISQICFLLSRNTLIVYFTCRACVCACACGLNRNGGCVVWYLIQRERNSSLGREC